MADTSSPDFDLREQLVRIDRAQAEIHKFQAEYVKLQAEAAKMTRERAVIPWHIIATLLAGGAAFFAAGAAFVKLFG